MNLIFRKNVPFVKSPSGKYLPGILVSASEKTFRIMSSPRISLLFLGIWLHFGVLNACRKREYGRPSETASFITTLFLHLCHESSYLQIPASDPLIGLQRRGWLSHRSVRAREPLDHLVGKNSGATELCVCHWDSPTTAKWMLWVFGTPSIAYNRLLSW